MAKPFNEWTYKDAEKRVAEAAGGETGGTLLKLNRLFYDGDHWQDGDGWIGPAPRKGEDGHQEAMAAIAKAFTSRNVIAEVVDRHAAGVVGREPSWALTLREPPELDDKGEPEEIQDADRDLIAEAEAALTEWWDDRGLPEVFQEAASTLLWAERAALRLYVPRGLLEDLSTGEGEATTGVSAGDLQEALGKLYVDHPKPEAAAVWEDPDTKRQVAIFLYEEEAEEEGGEGAQFAELVYLQEDAEEGAATEGEGVQTIIRRVGKDGQPQDFPQRFNGRLTMDEMSRRALITEQVRQGQRALNLALSMLPRNVTTGGFLEQVLLNAQMPGRWEEDAAGQARKFIPEPYQRGPGTVNFIRGIEVGEDQQGRAVLTDPQVEWREPVPVDSSVDAKNSHYADILNEVDQAHILLSSEAVSGRSREQARADFESSLRLSQSRLERSGRWLLETALAMAEAFMGSPGKYTERLRVTFQCHVHLGPVSPEERKQNADDMKAGLVSRETAMSQSGIQDVDAEMERMRREETARIDIARRRGEAMKAWTDAGAGIREAALASGMTEEEVKATFPEFGGAGRDEEPLEQ